MRGDTKNALYRAAIPMTALAAAGHDVQWEWRTKVDFNVAMLESCDVVYIHRLYDELVQRIARHLRAEGVGLWWDNDDDISAVPRNHLIYREVGGSNGAKIVAGMKKLMTIADVVSTPSTVLADRYRSLGVECVRVLENYVPDAFTRTQRHRPQNGEIVVGWVAGSEHRHDAERLQLREVLQRLVATQPSVAVASVGVNLGLPERYRHTRHVPLHELASTDAEFDVGIAPIVDSPFNRARSDIKLKEYAAVGVPWLASPVGPYEGHGERQGGRLVPDDAWFGELTALVENPRLRSSLAKQAARWGREQTIGRNVAVWDAALREAAEHGRQRRAASGT
jgi:glycosyltransferase involved in cell wall biosynthesis